MYLWANFGLKFTLFHKGKMAKISPKINKIEIWPKKRPKVINSQNKRQDRQDKQNWHSSKLDFPGNL